MPRRTRLPPGQLIFVNVQFRPTNLRVLTQGNLVQQVLPSPTGLMRPNSSPLRFSVKDGVNPGELVTYLPLTTVPDASGGGGVAFGAQMRYHPTQGTNGIADWGNAHQFRLVWLVWSRNTDSYTAESWCDEIISQGVIAIEIDRWYNGGWSSHVCGLPFNDFNIQRGTAYFVKATSSGTITPSKLVSHSRTQIIGQTEKVAPQVGPSPPRPPLPTLGEGEDPPRIPPLPKLGEGWGEGEGRFRGVLLFPFGDNRASG